MPTPLLGRNAFIQFFKDDQYLLFGCATNLSYKMHTDVVETGTVGTGYWRDVEGDGNSYTIDLSGLTVFDETGYFTSGDLADAQKQMVGVEFRIVFNDASGGLLKHIFGTALVVDCDLSAGVEFVNSSFSLIGKGEPFIGIQPTCTAEIAEADVTIEPREFGFIHDVEVLNVTVEVAASYDYRLDGGAIQTSFAPTFTVNAADGGSPYGDHVLEVWPVCGNGVRGIKATKNFTVSL